MRRGLLWAGMAATAPCVLLLIALPVGFVMEVGKQARLRVVNAGSRTFRVTPLRGSPEPPALVGLTLHPLLPLPAFQGGDLLLPPGAAVVLHYRARRCGLRLALRDETGRLFEMTLPPEFAGPDTLAGREIVVGAASVLQVASPEVAAAVGSRTQLLGWTFLLLAPLGTLVFVRLNRARRAIPAPVRLPGE